MEERESSTVGKELEQVAKAKMRHLLIKQGGLEVRPTEGKAPEKEQEASREDGAERAATWLPRSESSQMWHMRVLASHSSSNLNRYGQERCLTNEKQILLEENLSSGLRVYIK